MKKQRKKTSLKQKNQKQPKSLVEVIEKCPARFFGDEDRKESFVSFIKAADGKKWRNTSGV